LKIYHRHEAWLDEAMVTEIPQSGSVAPTPDMGGMGGMM
jgi:hypothetical protein